MDLGFFFQVSIVMNNDSMDIHKQFFVCAFMS